MKENRVPILDVTVDSVTMAEAVAKIESFMNSKEPRLVATANAEMLMMADSDAELKTILNDAALVVPDGAGTVWAARHQGYAMPERVAGYDMAQQLLAVSAKKGYRVFFLGSAPGVAQRAKKNAEVKFPGVKIVGVHDGYFNELAEGELINQIKLAKPHLLLVALGVPRQEKWIKEHMKDLNVPVSIGVGGTFDVMAGVVKRAPLWMQRAKLEWLYRGLKQPKRIGRLMALPKFVIKVYQEKKH